MQNKLNKRSSKLLEKRRSMVFCYQNCSDLLWENIVLVLKENFNKLEFQLEKSFWVLDTNREKLENSWTLNWTTGPNQPKSQIMLHIRSLFRMTLVSLVSYHFLPLTYMHLTFIYLSIIKLIELNLRSSCLQQSGKKRGKFNWKFTNFSFK